jgi:hypothetical protein
VVIEHIVVFVENTDYAGDTMKRFKRELLVAILAACFALATGPMPLAGQDSASGLLFRWQVRIDYQNEITTQEYLFYRDGLLILKSSTGTVTYLRGTSDPVAFANLKKVFTDNRIGFVKSDECITSVNPYPTGASFEAVVTWFGKNGRQNRFSYASGGFEACPPEVDAIALAIEVNTQKSRDTDVVQTVP